MFPLGAREVAGAVDMSTMSTIVHAWQVELMAKAKVTTRRAVAGRCLTCGERTIRGELEDGTLVEVTARAIGPAPELRAFVAGVASYRASWHGAMQLDVRTRRQIKLSPAGYAGSHIYLEHRCKEATS